ncbi:MAG: hypothetical protein ACD_47C00177G0002 [uncultured bacterium]|nr:MAG: hypothetical protein ACD_47C00177G0002 [uncultured bacterium]
MDFFSTMVLIIGLIIASDLRFLSSSPPFITEICEEFERELRVSSCIRTLLMPLLRSTWKPE